MHIPHKKAFNKMSTLICKFLYNLPQTREWVRWVVISLIIGMVIYFIKQKKDKLYTYFHIRSIFPLYLWSLAGLWKQNIFILVIYETKPAHRIIV